MRAWVQAAPTDGQANEAFTRLLAKKLGIAHSRISIVSGQTCRQKRIEIEGMSEAEFLQKIASI